MRDNTVEKNEGQYYGGGLYIVAPTIELTGNRIRNNIAWGDAHTGGDGWRDVHRMSRALRRLLYRNTDFD